MGKMGREEKGGRKKEGKRRERKGGRVTYVGNLFSFFLNRVTEVLLHHAHRRHSVGAESLDDL